MIKLIKGDCLEHMKGMHEGLIDLTVTSPPYDKLRTYEGSLQWNDEIWKAILKELYRVTKPGGVVVWVVGDATVKGSETGTSFKQALYAMECGFNLHDTMIYEKDAIPFPDKNRYQQSFEYMFIFSKGSPSFKNIIHDRKNKSFGQKVRGGGRNKNGDTVRAHGFGRPIKEFGARWNIWKLSINKGNNITGHPAAFPEQLAHDHIISWSNEGDIVFDPFMGSGTTGKMAKQLNRSFIGSEKVEEYFKIACERINKETAQQTLF